jgi:hypothetical protein
LYSIEVWKEEEEEEDAVEEDEPASAPKASNVHKAGGASRSSGLGIGCGAHKKRRGNQPPDQSRKELTEATKDKKNGGRRRWMKRQMPSRHAMPVTTSPPSLELSQQPPREYARPQIEKPLLHHGRVAARRRRVLVAGELGYSVGAVYTSLTGFATESGTGTVQLTCLGRWLEASGFLLWDLGMEMEYKFDLGAVLVPRHSFVRSVRLVGQEETYRDVTLKAVDPSWSSSSSAWTSPDGSDGDPAVVAMNCRDVIDRIPFAEAKPTAT